MFPLQFGLNILLVYWWDILIDHWSQSENEFSTDATNHVLSNLRPTNLAKKIRLKLCSISIKITLEPDNPLSDQHHKNHCTVENASNQNASHSQHTLINYLIKSQNTSNEL